jgi:hypothetical protein
MLESIWALLDLPLIAGCEYHDDPVIIRREVVPCRRLLHVKRYLCGAKRIAAGKRRRIILELYITKPAFRINAFVMNPGL